MGGRGKESPYSWMYRYIDIDIYIIFQELETEGYGCALLLTRWKFRVYQSKIRTEPHTGKEKAIPALPQRAANPAHHELTQVCGAESLNSSSETPN